MTSEELFSLQEPDVKTARLEAQLAVCVLGNLERWAPSKSRDRIALVAAYGHLEAAMGALRPAVDGIRKELK